MKRLLCCAACCILSAAAMPAALGAPALHLEVFKSKRLLQLYAGASLIKSYRIALGLNPIPPKTRQGDYATPEGRYRISHKNPRSQFFRSLGINYPNVEDATSGLRNGLISEQEYRAILAAHALRRPPPANTALGGAIFIHGHGAERDWTWGCIALEDRDMLELFQRVPVGTEVVIHP